MSSKRWWTVISSREICQLRKRLLSYLGRSFTSIVSADREDLVQQALLILIRNKERVLPDDDGLFRYLRRVAKNAALDLTKSSAHRIATARTRSDTRVSVGAPALKGFSDVAQLLDFDANSLSAPAQTEKKEEIQEIRRIFCELDDLTRLILWSYVVDGQSINAIAEQLGKNWHQVDYMIEQSLERFRRQFS